MRTFKTDSVSNSQKCNMVFLTAVIMLYITSLIHFITGNLYLFTRFTSCNHQSLAMNNLFSIYLQACLRTTILTGMFSQISAWLATPSGIVSECHFLSEGHTGCSICNFSATCNSSLNYTAYPFNFPLMGLPTYYVTFLFILVLGSPLIRTWAPCRAVCFVHCTFSAYTSAWQMLSTYYVFGKWLSAQHLCKTVIFISISTYIISFNSQIMLMVRP